MLIDDIWVTQNGLRDLENLQSMVEFLKGGGKFSKPLRLFQFGTRKVVYLHDGHHRLAAKFLAEQYTLEAEEYSLTYYKTSDYLLTHFENGWITPFDPARQLRVADLTQVKKEIMDYLCDLYSQESSDIWKIHTVREYSYADLQRKFNYAVPRNDIRNIRDLVKQQNILVESVE